MCPISGTMLRTESTGRGFRPGPGAELLLLLLRYDVFSSSQIRALVHVESLNSLALQETVDVLGKAVSAIDPLQ